MNKTFYYTVHQIDQVVVEMSPYIVHGAIVAISGLLGAGKTTFVQRLCASLGVIGPVMSPTYAYIGTHEAAGQMIYHFDLYRMAGAEEFEVFGMSDYLQNRRALVLIEWPDRISELLASEEYAHRVVALHFKYVAENHDMRSVSLCAVAHHEHE